MSTRYSVIFDDYTDRHFIKAFKKKHSERIWLVTENAIRAACANFEETILLDQCDLINQLENLQLCKLDFAVAGTGKSPKKSGNRIILIADTENKTVTILLVYHKSDIVKSGGETLAWKKIIVENFPQYQNLL